MTRPRIWKNTRFGGLPWHATHPDSPERLRLCKTWREAMEFVQEELQNPLPLELGRIDITYAGGKVFLHDELDDDMIVLGPRHWRPLARALTRLADKEGVK